MTTETMFGKAMKRREDPRMITGRGKYVDDLHFPGMQSVVFVRSPYAHAKITKIDTSAAEKHPGVMKVYTGKDFGHVPVPCGVNLPNSNQISPMYPAMATDVVRHTGQIVAVVIASDTGTARDAAELVQVDYEPLAVTVDAEKAAQPGAPQVHPDVPNNISFTWRLAGGDIDAAFGQAEVVIKQRLINQRLIPNAMETRGVAARYDHATGEITLWDTDQNPHVIRLLLCLVTGLPENKVRVIAPDVGGGFGSKVFLYAEQSLMALMTKDLGVPMKWIETRSENYLSTTHGRDHVTYAEMAFKRDGTLLGLRVKTYANLGAYLTTFAPLIPTFLYGPLLPGVYTLPALDCEVLGVFTNTVSVDAYRGAGRPEACYLIERLMDLAADELGIDPAEIRRRNFIPPDNFPHTTIAGMMYDSGNYEANMDKALEQFGYARWREEQAKARQKGRYLGIGLISYIEACGIAPSAAAGAMGAGAGLWESSVVRVHPTGKVTVLTGSSTHGQGHETSFAQLVADELGVPYEDVDIVHGDTGLIQFGMGTYGSRSLAVGGTAILKSCQKLVEKGKKIAAHLLEASEADIEYTGGKFSVKGSPDRAKAFGEVVLMSYLAHNYPQNLEPGFEAQTFFDPINLVYPAGTYMAIVEVDPETGVVTPLKFYCMDDCGRVLNPMIAEGQVHGGVAQGIGQALYENAVYDENGQLLSGSMMDYAVPKITQLPSYTTEFAGVPSPSNPLGVKGIGEAGTIGATPAIANAVVDALSPLGIRHIDLPLTPQNVWKAIQQAKQ
ncbi:MAG TPA: xanthine dehydrogenase family protein molybdopterin-binding subunit [Roseiflexaceae bacterium]|nr:xanthine dehydrogenase family protein molybdopterin-binding subunit [Roseiflexaceae bacterium]